VKRDLKGFREHLRKRLSEGSTTTYIRAVEAALEHSPQDLPKFALQKHLSHSTKHTYLAALRAWAEFVGDKKLQESLHSPELRRKLRDARREEHRTQDRHDVQPFSKEEERRVYTVLRQWKEDPALPVWQWPAVSMMFSLGPRAGAALAGMARRDVGAALRSGVELVIVTRGAKERTVPAVLVLEELQYLVDLEQSWEILADLIISDRAPDSPRKVANAYERIRLCIKKLAEEVDIPPEELHPHRFRHNAANRLYTATLDIVKVQKFLGHEDSKTTLRYLKGDSTAAIGEDLLEAMKGLREE
jgi:integrase